MTTSVIKTIYCDRCKSVIEKQDSYRGYVSGTLMGQISCIYVDQCVWPVWPFDVEKVDLCSKCVESFVRWAKMRTEGS